MKNTTSFSFGDLKIKSNRLPGREIIITPAGSIDSNTAEIFQRETESLMEGGGPVLLDMAAVRYISSIGLSALISVEKKARTLQIAFGLYDPARSVQRVLQISKLDFMELKPAALELSHPFYAYIQAQEPERAKRRKEAEEKEKKKTLPARAVRKTA